MIYTIKQGKHFANGTNFGFHSNGAAVSKTVKFYDNCAYDLGNINQADINKLYGFSVGLFSGNDYNSARFGWRWSIPKQKIELLAYVYVNGKRINEWDRDILITSVPLETEVYTELSISPTNYLFKVQQEGKFEYEEVKYLPRAGSGTGYNQFPYFGGDEVAPHDMTIELK